MTAPERGKGGASFDASVVIPSYNNRESLLQTLESFRRQTLDPGRFELVVVIDGSTDGSREALDRQRYPFHLQVVEQPNRGRAAAINHGVRRATGRVIVITDADVLVNPEFIESHLEGQCRGDVVIGPIPLDDSSPMSFLTDGVEQWADEHTRAMESRSRPIRATEIYGANISLSRADFLAVGGMREDIRRCEDFQFGRKLLEEGLEVVFEPGAIAYQVYDKSFPAWCQDFYIDGRSHAQVVREFPELGKDLEIGQYYPMTLVQRILRPLVMRRTLPGVLFLSVASFLMERARRLGLRWRLLAVCQGVIGDCYYFQGVWDEARDRDEFDALVGTE